jgi:hypothetical protein
VFDAATVISDVHLVAYSLIHARFDASNYGRGSLSRLAIGFRKAPEISTFRSHAVYNMINLNTGSIISMLDHLHYNIAARFRRLCKRITCNIEREWAYTTHDLEASAEVVGSCVVCDFDGTLATGPNLIDCKCQCKAITCHCKKSKYT